jgi:hypothetical protein
MPEQNTAKDLKKLEKIMLLSAFNIYCDNFPEELEISL